MFRTEDLRVYKKAVDFGEEVIRVLDRPPRGIGKSLADQLVRAASSVAANIAEGNGRWGKKDRKKFFHIARGSLMECVPFLGFLKTAGAISKSEHHALREKIDPISSMLWGLIEGVDDKRKKG